MLRPGRPTLPLLLALLAAAPTLGAQEAPGSLRLGVSLGATGLVGLLVEHVDGRRSLELSVGTFGFRDVSLSVVGRVYLGPSELRPTVGAGLWAVLVPPSEGRRSGLALLARAPVGLSWSAAPRHRIGVDVSLSRALWIRRADPEPLPMNSRLVPLPGVSYRWIP